MCKVIAFTNASKLDVKKASEFIGNTLLDIERDGFGYAMQGIDGVFGEKCIKEKFKSRLNLKPSKVPHNIIEQTHQVFGNISKVIGPAIFHGRTSTNKPGLINTHPMQIKGYNLIHNGVVTDLGPKYTKQTDNDSEDVLHRYIDGGIDSVAKNLTGYYAFCALDPDGKLIVARDRIAYLSITWSESHDTYIIGTTAELIKDVAKKLKMKIDPIEDFKKDFMAVFSLNTIVECRDFISLGYTQREAKHAENSLGRKLDKDFRSEGAEIYDAYSDEFNQDFDSVIEELNYLDETYKIYDRTDTQIEHYEFYKLDMSSQMECTITRPDGTYLDLEQLRYDDVI